VELWVSKALILELMDEASVQFEVVHRVELTFNGVKKLGCVGTSRNVPRRLDIGIF